MKTFASFAAKIFARYQRRSFDAATLSTKVAFLNAKEEYVRFVGLPLRKSSHPYRLQMPFFDIGTHFKPALILNRNLLSFRLCNFTIFDKEKISEVITQ